MKSIKVKDLPPLIMDRLGLVLYNNLYNLLHHDPNESAKIFRTIVINALHEYSRTYPIIRDIELKSGSTKCLIFSSNFHLYIDGSIPENRIVLKATGIKFVKNSGGFLSADYWYYDPDAYTLYFQYAMSVMQICYTADYPYVMNISEGDHEFTEDSKLYYLDIDEDVNFLVFLEYYVIRQLKHLHSSVELGLPVSMLKNLDQMYSELEQKKAEIVDVRHRILNTWRK